MSNRRPRRLRPQRRPAQQRVQAVVRSPAPAQRITPAGPSARDTETARAGVTPASIPVDGPVTSPADGPVSSSVPGALPPQVGCCLGASANPTMSRRCWPGSGATSGVRPSVTSGDRSSDFSGARRAYRRPWAGPESRRFSTSPSEGSVVSPQLVNLAASLDRAGRTPGGSGSAQCGTLCY